MPRQFATLLAVAFMLVAASASAQLNKVRLSATSVAVTELQFRIALLKGFYRDEGLDVEIVLIRGAVGMQALLGGSAASAIGRTPGCTAPSTSPRRA